MAEKRKQLNLRIPQEMADEIDRRCAEMGGMPRERFIRAVLEQHLAKPRTPLDLEEQPKGDRVVASGLCAPPGPVYELTGPPDVTPRFKK